MVIVDFVVTASIGIGDFVDVPPTALELKNGELLVDTFVVIGIGEGEPVFGSRKAGDDAVVAGVVVAVFGLPLFLFVIVFKIALPLDAHREEEVVYKLGKLGEGGIPLVPKLEGGEEDLGGGGHAFKKNAVGFDGFGDAGGGDDVVLV